LNFASAVGQVWVSLLVALLSSLFTACGATFVYKDNGIIPRTFFGMTVLDFENVNPPLNYGTTRTWNSLPMLDWADINSSPGVYQFERLDAFVQLNQARAADVIYTFGRTPRWASSQPGHSWSVRIRRVCAGRPEELG
jgi:hypothetical protein